MEFEFVDNFSKERLLKLFPKEAIDAGDVAGDKALILDYGRNQYDLPEILEMLQAHKISDVLIKISSLNDVKARIKKVIADVHKHSFYIRKKYTSIKIHLLYSKKFSWIINDLPARMAIEPTNVCDLDCIGCREQGYVPGFMSLERFNSIMSQVNKAQLISLYGFGEPLLHPDIIEFIDIAKTAGTEDVRISTGFNINNDGLLKKLAQSKLDKLIIGLDGASQETYGRFRRGGSFDLVVANIRKIREYNPHCKLFIQLIPNKYNEHEIDKVRALSKKLGVDYFSIRILSTRHDEILPENPRYRHRVKCKNFEDLQRLTLTKKKHICLLAMNSIGISQDGAVFPCTFLWGFNKLTPDCEKKKFFTKFPYNVFQMPLKDIWLDKEYFKLRCGFLEGYPIELCRACITVKWDMPPGKEIPVG